MDPRVPLSLADAFSVIGEAQSQAISVSIPGIVKSYDAGTRTATVQPAVNRLVPLVDDPELGVSEVLPALQNVPVCWPCGSNFEIVGTLAAGDPVLLVCQDRDISQWRASGDLSDPVDMRIHSWASVVAIPGLKSDNLAVPAAVDDAAALASLVLDRLNTLTTAVNDLRSHYLLHAHGGVTVGAGVTGAPTTAVTPPAAATTPAHVKSTVLKLGA